MIKNRRPNPRSNDAEVFILKNKNAIHMNSTTGVRTKEGH